MGGVGDREGGRGGSSGLRRLLPRRLKDAIAAHVRQVARQGKGDAPAFQDLAYLPFANGADSYRLPPLAPPPAPEGELPQPPEHLTNGPHSAQQGAEIAANMLRILAKGGFELGDGHRILDFGCRDGRVIRHLRHLADRCEIWGCDISAEHVAWCRRHLSPPFHFFTNTKVPHLPFRDGSFDFIYCGSVFTHIDDLAVAWLLELRRLLAPGGRLYVTIHDRHTLSLFEEPQAAAHPVIAYMRSHPDYPDPDGEFGMVTLGRDSLSQVFYDRAYFVRMAEPMFELLSQNPEAYLLQTALLFQPRGSR
ncbi:MAG TPA: class I SAM-dependent methyltransferase [Allosphingosinicella sp.]|jgi:SAM-dependent methyltransferase